MADHPIDILLRAKDQASKKIAGVNRELGILGRTSRGVKTATSNLLKLGAAGAAIGVGAGVLAIRSGLESLAERENVISATAAAIPAQRIPAGFDTTAFLRIAKLNFVRLQAANDAKNLDDIREFVSPELFAEIKMQMDERGNAPQQTDVVTLNADLLDVTTESNRHIASVHFSGTIREVVSAAATPFDEIWNLSKSIDGNGGWVVAGIQQLS